MKRYYGGDPVPNGLYLNLRTLEFKQLTGDRTRLPEPTTEKYVHLSTFLGLIVGAIFGLVFIILLPLIGIAGFIMFVAYKIGLMRNSRGRRALETFLVHH